MSESCKEVEKTVDTRRRTRRRKKKAAQINRDTITNYEAGASSEEQTSAIAGNKAVKVPNICAKRRRVYGRPSSHDRIGIASCYEQNSSKCSTPTGDNFEFGSDDEFDTAVESKLPHVLPTLLYLREIGLSRTMNRHRLVARTNKRLNARWGTLALRRPKATESNQDNVAAVTCSKSVTCQWEWRPFAQRSIPFTDLGTPFSDAILALSRDGSYMIGLGGGRSGEGSPAGDASCRPILAIRFYGVPSMAALKRRGTSTCSFLAAPDSPSPLLLTIPFLVGSVDSYENRNLTAPSSLFGESSGSPAADVPVRILTSCDGALGVAFILHSLSAAASSPELPAAQFVGTPAVQDEDALGTIFLFPLPGYHYRPRHTQLCHESPAQLVLSYKCANVRVVGGLRSHTIRNLLWPTRWIPMSMDRGSVAKGPSNEAGNIRLGGTAGSDKNGTIPWCDFFHEASSGYYLLFNDEDDGYRMTWILIDGSNISMNVKPVVDTGDENLGVSPMHPIRATRSDIITIPDEELVWTKTCSDVGTGNVVTEIPSEETIPSCMRVAFEAFFSVEALLSDILSRRPNLAQSSSTHLESRVSRVPNYFYNLISVLDDGRTLMLVVVFARGQQTGARKTKPAAIGAFLRLDIFDLSYNELEFVQHPSRSDSRFLRNWSNTLALNWRMRERRIGVYSLEKNASNFHAREVRNNASFHEDNTESEMDPKAWELTERKGKVIPMSSLYPFCDLISNEAVTSAEPVLKIGCRNAPIELSYK